MKQTKPKEIRDLSVQEIEQRIADDERELSQLRFRQAVAGLENPIVLRTLRRDIARLRTILKEKRAEGTEA
jgi:large subunit ribosomal protein L29